MAVKRLERGVEFGHVRCCFSWHRPYIYIRDMW